jgi:hypothetical protein
MKPHLCILVDLICLSLALGRAIANAAEDRALDQYQIEARVVPAESRLEAKLALRSRNDSFQAQPAMRLRLDPNMSTRQSLEIDSVEDAAGHALHWRYEPLKFANSSSDKGTVEIELPDPIQPQASVMLVIGFRSSGNHITRDLLMLQDDPYQSLDGWYPKAMSFGKDGWSIDDDRLADYDVTLKLPSGYMVASTGETAPDAMTDVQREVHLKSERTRGFTIYASPQWQRHQKKAGEVELSIFLPTEAASWADRILDAAADSIGFYKSEYAPFPTKHLDIICPGKLGDPAHGSSASYNVITIFLGGRLEEQYRFMVAHELAHQYFGVQVGLPRDSIGWVPTGLGLMMDEHYAAARGLDATYGRKIMRDFYFRAEQMGFDTTLSQSLEIPMRSPPPWSFGWNMSLAHGKAYAVCAMLRDLLGGEKFQNVVKQLIKVHSGSLIRDDDLINACETALGEKLDWFIADWIRGRATLDYEISGATHADGGWDVTVRRVGSGSFPVLVEMENDHGEKLRQRMDRTKDVATLHFKTMGTFKSAKIDPDNVYPDLKASNNMWPRSDQEQ